ncbi:MAG: hypothetical protein AAFY57_18790 [Cyanobacteria bacterium J06642_2]
MEKQGDEKLTGTIDSIAAITDCNCLLQSLPLRAIAIAVDAV